MSWSSTFDRNASQHNGGLVKPNTVCGQARENLELLAKSELSRHSSDERSTLSTRVFGVDELAIFFGCSAEKIKGLARKRELPAFKFGKSWYVREQDLEIYINRAVDPNLRSQKGCYLGLYF